MNRLMHRALNIATGMLLVIASGSPARADDTEIFFTTTKSGGDANLMLVLDTSGSMGDVASTATAPYDSTLTYSLKASGKKPAWNTDCEAGKLYYRSSDPVNMTPPTSCSGLSSIPFNFTALTDKTNQNRCKASIAALQYGSGYSSRAGFYKGTFIRWGGSSSSKKDWQATFDVSANAEAIECKEDAGIDGDLSSSGNKYPRPGQSSDSPGRWGSAAQSWWTANTANVGKDYVLWSPNYIAYTYKPGTTSLTRMDVVKEAAKNLISNVSNMNVGLMRYDTTGKGGMVMAPARPIDEGTNRADLIASIDTFNYAGPTPLSETMFEAYAYYAGKDVNYGADSRICSVEAHNANCPSTLQVKWPSVASSRFPATATGKSYDSPADASCQNNYIVFLTDGMPKEDDDSDDAIKSVTGAACSDPPKKVGTGDGTGACLSSLTKYMYENDLRSGVEGIQNVKTYFIGFGDDFAGGLNDAFDYLDTAAKAGGGRAFQATGIEQLEGAFNSIVNEVVQTNTTFTSPTVAVNAFNRTQTLNDLYVSVFQPSLKRHWPGNLKKYKVEEGAIVDSKGNTAVNSSSGFFADSAVSYWGSVTDGYSVTLGGAANKIPSPTTRTIYTYIGANNPSTPQSLDAFGKSNTSLNDATLGLGASGDPTRDDLIDWALGQDVTDSDPANGNNTETRHVMGDPIHAQPTVVIYGGTTTTPSLDDAAIFVPTNDGYLHAVDTSSGTELWAFIPQESLPGLKSLYQNQTSSTKQYALDGEIRVLKYDVNGDGIVDADAGDRVILYFGMGRGGSRYYALDVTSKTSPKFMWSLDQSVLPELGQAWSTPVVARVNVNGASQNSQKLVLIIGGGYDSGEDGTFYVTTAASGNRIYMVDALKGSLLWSAGAEASNANLKLTRMDHSIPGTVTVLDTDSDGYADRLYAGDTAAQLWRFDITNGNPANTLVAGGVLASLGTHDDSPHTEQAARRFYNSPDVAAIQQPGHMPFFSIAIGSGYRGHPLNIINRDRFYALRDLKPFTKMTQAQYDDFAIITDSDLQDITKDLSPTIPANSTGWKLLLNQPDDVWQGEKVLSSSNTFGDKIFFTTYRPSQSSTNSCTSNSAGTGSNRAFTVSALDGSPIRHQNDTGTGDDGGGDDGGDNDSATPEDRFEELHQGGIAPEITFLFPEPNKVICLSGVEVLGACTNFNSRVKTYWRDSKAN